MKKYFIQHYKGQWFLLPVIGIKRCAIWTENTYQYNLCIAWWNFGIDIKLFRKKYD